MTAVVFMAACLLLQGCDGEDNPDPGVAKRTSASLFSFESCANLASALKESLREEMQAQLRSLDDMVYKGIPEMDGGGAFPVPSPAADDTRQEGVDYSGTNNQEAGVDEADFVKTDGYYIYLLSGDSFVIMGVPEFGQLVEGPTLELEGYPSQMLLGSDDNGTSATRAVIFSSVYPGNITETHLLYDVISDKDDPDWYYRSSVLTKITVVDLADPASPTIKRELYLEGSYQTARRHESAVHITAYSWMDVAGLQYWPDLSDAYYRLDPQDPLRSILWDEAVEKAIADNDELIDQLTLEDLVPRIYEISPQGSVAVHDFTGDACNNFVIAEDGISRGFTSIISFDILGEDITIDADHIVSNWSTIYASTDALLIAEPAQDWWWYRDNDEYDEATNIHRFDITDNGTATYSGSGRIDGTVEDQFSLSEYDGYIRVAATTGQWNRWWVDSPPEPENHVYVLAGEEELAVVGHIGGIAVGERIWSSRFIGERAYLVTFRNIDPLWTIDLSDPANPEIMGELEVPGVSTYVHPLDDDHLLTIGYGGDEEGLDWSVMVSLFDVSDFTNPLHTDNFTLAPSGSDDWDSWTWSEALWEHKAFQYWAPKKLLAVPLSTDRYYCPDRKEDCRYEYISELVLISVDTENGLSLYGSVDHSPFYNVDPYMYWYYTDVRRSIFMGDYIYAVGEQVITASSLDDLAITDSAELPGRQYGGYYYMEVDL